MALIDELKGMMSISNDKHDAFLNAMIPVLIESIEIECNRTFKRSSKGEYDLPAGVKLYMKEALQYNMAGKLKSRSLGNVSYSYDTSYPAHISRMLGPYRVMRMGGRGYGRR